MTKDPSPVVELVARDATVQKLMDGYASGHITFSELYVSFYERGWSTLSLYEVCRAIDANKQERSDHD